MFISDFHQFGGKDTETGALKNVLEHQGILAPHTREPYSEELLFGIGGGLGFAYFLFEKNGAHPIHLGTRIHTRETDRPEFFLNIARRIGLRFRVQNSSSASAAEANLKRHLQQGQTPIVSADPQRLPLAGLHVPVNAYYCLVVYGLDEEQDRVLLAGGSKMPLSVARGELKHARETSWSPKFRAMVIEGQESEPDVRAAVVQGIRNCCQQMNEGLGITNFGIRGMEKWAHVLTSGKEKKSWPKIFSPGPTLFEALYSIYVQISVRGNTGHAHRAFYAAFLEEAAELLSVPGLRTAADAYRECDRMWKAVAEAHLPDAAPLFQQAKELTRRQRDVFDSKGDQAAGEIRSLRSGLERVAQEASEAFPLSFQDSRMLLSELRTRILKLRQAESEALRALESAIGSCSTELPTRNSEQPRYEHQPTQSVGP